MKIHFCLFALVFTACPPSRDPASPNPIPAPDSDLCGQMCDHIGPNGLKCPEGDSVYDSDRPGTRGIPNKTCEDFCKEQQDNGAFVNPRCILQIKSCGEIEAARQKTCQ